jgi:hypothetical protein
MENLAAIRRKWAEISRRVPRASRWTEGALGTAVTIVDAVSYPVQLLLDAVARLIARAFEGTGVPYLQSGLLGAPLLPRAECWVDPAHFSLLVDIGSKAFPGCGLTRSTREELFARWLAANANVFRFIVLDEDPGVPRRIGYTCILPLKKDSYYRYFRGELSEYHFSAIDITKPSYVAPPRYLCLQAFALHERNVDEAHWVALYQHIVMHLYVLMRGNVANLPKIIAEGETRSGKRVLARRGFVEVGLSANGFPLFELDLAVPDEQMRKEAGDTKREILRLFKLYGAEHAQLHARSQPLLALQAGSGTD